MKLLITGATGNTGSEVVKQLTEQGTPCSALVTDKKKMDVVAGVNWVEGNYTDVDSLIAAFKEIEGIYVAMPAHPDNELWMNNILEAAKETGVKQVVKLSVMGANSDASSEIVRVHAKTDNLIKESGIKYTLLQPNPFYQNTFSSKHTIKENNAIYMSLGDSKLSFIDIRDIAAVAIESLTESDYENKVYKLSGPETLDYYDVAEILSRSIGKEVTYYPITDEAMKSGMLEAGVPEWGADKLSEIFSWFAKEGDGSVTHDVEIVLGRKPYSFEKFASDYKAMFQ